MSDFKLTFDIASGAFEKEMVAFNGTIAEVATATMDEVLDIVKTQSRADIARAGFSKRWQNALRVVRYPKKGRTAIDAAIFLFHNIPYAGIFEAGAHIRGNPLLWLPLSTTPPRISGRMTKPGAVASILGGTSKLVSMGDSKNGTPILGARLRLSRAAAARATPKVTLAAIKRGNGEGSGVLRTIPLFFGIRETNVPRQLSIGEICAKARDRIPALYAQRISTVIS